MSTALGTYADIVALVPKHGQLLDAIRAKVFELHPEAVEIGRPGDRAVSWGWGPAKMSEAYLYALPCKNHVNLGFYQGACLPDPAGHLTGSGKSMRHISLTSAEPLADLALGDLILSAKEERRAALIQSRRL